MMYNIKIELSPLIFSVEVNSNEYIFQTIESIRKKKHISPSLSCIFMYKGFILPMFKKWGEFDSEQLIFNINRMKTIKVVSYNESGANLVPTFYGLTDLLRKERDDNIRNLEVDLKQHKFLFLTNLLEMNRIESIIFITTQLRWDIPSIYINEHEILGINLRNCNITKIPESIADLKHVNYIDLSFNMIKEIPEDIQNLKNLKHLELGTNKLKLLPEGLGAIENLEFLDVSFNNLREIPDSINKCTSLKEFFISFNDIREIPKVLIERQGNLIYSAKKNPFALKMGEEFMKENYLGKC
ncbi:MAG: leucine-rich repeat domain-containing protein [Promethearchaeota archaeon]